MFIIRWVGKLLSLPFQWAGQLCVSLAPALGVPLAGALGVQLLKIAWELGRSGAVAGTTLAAIARNSGNSPAIAQAEKWLARHPQAQTAAWLGLMAIDVDSDPDAAQSYVELSLELGDDPRGLRDLATFLIAVRDEDPDSAFQLAQEFTERRDLNPMLSKLVYSELLWCSLRKKRFDEADRLARFILEIEEDPAANIAMWALCKRRGQTGQGEAYLRNAQGMAEHERQYYLAVANAAIGCDEDADIALEELGERNEEIAARARRVISSKEPD